MFTFCDYIFDVKYGHILVSHSNPMQSYRIGNGKVVAQLHVNGHDSFLFQEDMQ